jgi:sugar O-acyltransferase (sialic acid O-acetyltransferase NeuD family)
MIIYGAGAAGIETVALILKEKNIIDICFFDEDKTKQNINIGIHNFPVLHSHKELQDFIQQSNDNRYLITIGHPRLKEKMEKKISKLPVISSMYISKNAWVFDSAFIDNGSIIQPNTFISFQSTIGKFVTLHINSTVGHKAKIGDYTNIGPGCNIIGPCEIGDFCFIGAGCIIYPDVKIGKNAVISSGSIIKNDVPEYHSV